MGRLRTITVPDATGGGSSMACYGYAGWQCIHYVRDKGHFAFCDTEWPACSNHQGEDGDYCGVVTDPPPGDDIIISDTGGGTIDVSAYGEGADQEIFKEITAPECASFSFPASPLRSGYFLGSIFVSFYSR
jgi:hypothetical protein